MDALVSTGVADSTFLGVGIGVFVVPFLAALILIFFGRKLPRGGDWVAQTAIVACALGALHLFWHVIVQDGRAGWSWSSAEQGLAWDWIHIADFRLTVGILWDNLSIIMATMVTIVASCIFFFSAGYMHGDRDYPRFFAYLSYFCFAMMGLVVVDNLLFLFIFWELVGVGSYLLIGFFYDQEEPPKASLKAFMVNRVGDVLFLLGIILCWMMFGTLNYTEIFDRLRDGQFLDSAEAWMVLHDWTPHGMVTLSGILIFCGGCGLYVSVAAGDDSQVVRLYLASALQRLDLFGKGIGIADLGHLVQRRQTDAKIRPGLSAVELLLGRGADLFDLQPMFRLCDDLLDVLLDSLCAAKPRERLTLGPLIFEFCQVGLDRRMFRFVVFDLVAEFLDRWHQADDAVVSSCGTEQCAGQILEVFGGSRRLRHSSQFLEADQVDFGMGAQVVGLRICRSDGCIGRLYELC